MAFLLRRLGWMAFTLWVVFTISFFLMRALPGGPFSSERKLPEAIERNIREHYKLDDPLVVQYLRQLGYALIFDFGYSYKLADFRVGEIILQGLPISCTIGILALAVALGLGLATGIFAAVRRGTFLDYVFRGIATLGIAVPNFVIAGLSIILAVFVVRIFPAGGWGSLSQAMLPALCLGLPYAAYIARLTRSGMLDVLGQDYIRTAKAKGLTPAQIIFKHAIWGALLPVVTFLGPATAGILTGSIVLETIFAIPGIGMHLINAVTQRDYTLAMGLIMVDTAILCGLNLMIDLSYVWLDPRVKVAE